LDKIINIQQVIENEFTIEEAKQMIVMHKGEAYTFFDEGCTRHVFVNKDETKVIKLLQRDSGFDFNQEEVNIYTKANDADKAKMAKTELSHNMVEQEYVTPIKFGGKKLSISEKLFASKCRNEVGWNKDGNLVCFDLDEYMKY
jgi:hypothetical protein